MYTNVNLICLKAKIKGLATAGVHSRIFINATVKEARMHHWLVKRQIGDDARSHMLAYGILRGISYLKMEPNCRADNSPNAQRIFEIVKAHSDFWSAKKLTIETIKEKLSRPKVEEVVAA
jgi:hypothetical protein